MNATDVRATGQRIVTVQEIEDAALAADEIADLIVCVRMTAADATTQSDAMGGIERLATSLSVRLSALVE